MGQVEPGLAAEDEVGDQLGSRRRELQAGALVAGGDDEIGEARRRTDVRPGVDAAGPQPRPDRLDLGLARSGQSRAPRRAGRGRPARVGRRRSPAFSSVAPIRTRPSSRGTR